MKNKNTETDLDRKKSASDEEFERYLNMECDMEVPRKLKRKLKKILKGKKVHQSTPKKETVRHHVSVRVITATAILAVVLFCASCAFVTNVVKFIGWKSNYSHEDGAMTISEKTDYSGEVLFKAKYPSYLPEGFEMLKESSYNQKNKVFYVNEKGSIITYEQSVFGNSSKSISSKDENKRSVKVGEFDAVAVVVEENGDTRNTVSWHDGCMSYSVGAKLSFDELVRIAESIG